MILNTSNQEVFVCFYLQVKIKYVQDRYQLPTALNSKEKYAKAIAFAVGCDYWSAIHVDDDYYYTSLSCI
jgi:hypothetical protein